MPDATLNLKGYHVWSRDRKGKKGGGVMIHSKGKLVAHEFTPETSRAEIITIEVQLGGKNILISTIYAPPLTKAWEKEEHERKLRDTLQDMSRVIEKASQKNHMFIMGAISFQNGLKFASQMINCVWKLH